MALEAVIAFLTTLGISQQAALVVWQPLGIFVIGVVLYSIFVFRFYRFVARKDVIELRLTQYAQGVERLGNVARILLYGVEYAVLFPVFTVIWFLVFTGFLAVLARGYTIDALLLVSMTIVTAIRITSYYTENLSQDLAKLVPFSMLGIFLVQGSEFSSLGRAFSLLFEIPGEWKTVLYYLGFLILLEFTLRSADLITGGTATTEAEAMTDAAETAD